MGDVNDSDEDSGKDSDDDTEQVGESISHASSYPVILTSLNVSRSEALDTSLLDYPLGFRPYITLL